MFGDASQNTKTGIYEIDEGDTLNFRASPDSRASEYKMFLHHKVEIGTMVKNGAAADLSAGKADLDDAGNYYTVVKYTYQGAEYSASSNPVTVAVKGI